jgi:mannosyltransferase OCH1-like enzyme
MPYKRYLFFLLLLTCNPSLFPQNSTNLAKLRINSIFIKNQCTTTKIITINTLYKCPSCLDITKKITNRDIPASKKTLISLDNDSIIDIMNIEGKITNQISFDTKKSIHTVTITEKNNPSMEIYDDDFNFTKMMNEDINLENFIKTCNQLPITFGKRFRGFNLFNINVFAFYKKMESLYTKNFPLMYKDISKNTKTPKIPLTIHNIWLGSEIPLYYKKKMKIWKKQHPSWKKICWTEKIIEYLLKKKTTILFKNEKEFLEAYLQKNYAKASDILRYEIIYQLGGLYLDVDFDCLEKFDKLHTSYDFYASLEHPCTAAAGCFNGLIGAKPQHPILRSCIEGISNAENHEHLFSYCTNKIDLELEKTWILTGPGLFSKSIFHQSNLQSNDIVFPYQFFAPIDKYLSKSMKYFSFCFHDYNRKNYPEKHWTDMFLFAN